MDYLDSGASASSAPQGGFATLGLRLKLGYWFRSDHKAIGLQYLWLALGSVFVGMLMSLVMRAKLVWPLPSSLLTSFGDSPERYAAVTLLHGSLMVFMALTAAPQAGFGSFLLPVQIGANDFAFPKFSFAGFWATAISLLGMIAAFFLQPEHGLMLWIASVALFCAASLLTSLNFCVTVIDSRAKGMTLPRMPITVWAWFINAILSLLIFSILLAVCMCLFADRFLDTQLFFAVLTPAASSSEILVQWQRLFWFFSQALVYVAMLPCFGLATHLITTFARRAVWAQRAVVLALCALGVSGFYIWGEHLFESGLNPWSPLVFSSLAASLGIPAAILILSWFGTLWGAKIQSSTAMLFSLGFVSLFLVGGLSGLILSRHDLSGASSGDFVAGHYHLVMGVAATFALLAALFFWFPKMFGRDLDERLGKVHFWLTFVGVFCLFLPMHWLGLIAHAGKPPENPAALAAVVAILQSLVTAATLFTVAAQTFFVANIVRTLRGSVREPRSNLYPATTLEWALPSPLPSLNFQSEPVVYRGAYEFCSVDSTESAACANDFLPQHIAPNAANATPCAPTDFLGESIPPNPEPAGAG
jgi:cytochrome c oxidase subunit I